MYLYSFGSGTANKTRNVGINAQIARYKALRFPKWGVNPFNVETGTNFLVRWSKFAKFLSSALPEGCAIMKVLRKTRKLEERLSMAMADSQWSWGFAWATMQSFTARRGTAWWRGTEVARTAQGARPGGPRWHVANLNGSSWGKLPRFYGHNKSGVRVVEVVLRNLL